MKQPRFWNNCAFFLHVDNPTIWLPSLSTTLLFSLLILLTTCSPPTPKPISPAFYYWQTSLSISPAQREYLKNAHCKKLYVKILDIGKESGSDAITPLAQLEIPPTENLSDFEIVRTIFITNEVFQQISEEKITWLAEKVAEFDARLNLPVSSAGVYEFQVDCDWTGSTKDAFFRFLEILRTKLPAGTLLSSTIRLHQYKFPNRTGVPPVDRGMLMCYNTGDIDDSEARNSILDLEDARKYIVGAPKKYPLPLDLALPIFSWTLVYRGDELWKIIPGSHKEVPLGILEKGTFLSGHYLRPGDLLRRETISADLLKKATQLAATTDLADDATLAFFHLDSTSLHDYPVQLIDAVCHIADSIRVKH